MAGSANLYSTILSFSPTLYYVCNETTGTTITDYGSAHANLTLSGSYSLAANTLITGDSTSFLYLGSNSTVGTSKAQGNLSNLSVPFSNSYTITALVTLYPNTSVFNTHIFSVASSGNTSGSNIQADLYYRTAQGFVNVQQSGAKSSNTASFKSFDELNRTNLVVFMKDSVNKIEKLYVFNANLSSFNSSLNLEGFTPLQTNTYVSEPTGGTSDTINIGQTGDGTQSNMMTIGHVAYITRLLTNTEVYNLATNANFAAALSLSIDTTSNTYAANISGYFGAPTVVKPSITIAADPTVDPFISHPDQGYQISTIRYFQ